MVRDREIAPKAHSDGEQVRSINLKLELPSVHLAGLPVMAGDYQIWKTEATQRPLGGCERMGFQQPKAGLQSQLASP
jgi:hypothetical protein